MLTKNCNKMQVISYKTHGMLHNTLKRLLVRFLRTNNFKLLLSFNVVLVGETALKHKVRKQKFNKKLFFLLDKNTNKSIQ